MDKRLGIEGSAASKLVQLMRKHGHNTDVTIDIGEVLSTSPLSVDVGGLEIEADDLVLTKLAASRTFSEGTAVIVLGDEQSQIYYVIDEAVM